MKKDFVQKAPELSGKKGEVVVIFQIDFEITELKKCRENYVFLIKTIILFTFTNIV